MRVEEIFRHVESLPLQLDNKSEPYLDERWLLSRDPATTVLNKSMVRRRIADIYAAIQYDPWLMRFTVIDKEGHIRIGPFQVVHKQQTRHLYLTFAKIAPLSALFFAEACLSEQTIQVVKA